VSRSTADVAVIGAGLAGLCTALALADAALDVLLVGDTRAGEASPTAGGILDASHGFTDPAILDLLRRAREDWPAFAATLTERSGVAIPLNREGTLELAHTVHEAEQLERRRSEHAHWLSAAQLAEREPALAHALGALHHPLDGAVNPLVVLRALKHIVARHPHIRVEQQTVTSITTGGVGDTILLRLQQGDPVSAMRVVIAGGAWSGTLPGVPMHLPIAPLRGQLMSVASKALRHVSFSGTSYAIPRGDGRTVLGVVDASAGFDATHTAEGVAAIRAGATAILPAFATAPMLSTWAGLRPMTRDGLPIIGPDAEVPAVVYACGHGRNGVLLAPMTGLLAAAVVAGAPQPTGAEAFSPLRFGR
jgi:glycine oxidase